MSMTVLMSPNSSYKLSANSLSLRLYMENPSSRFSKIFAAPPAALKEEGRIEGRAEERTAERAREAALLEAMSEQGCSDADILSAVMHGNRDELYREYGIECN